MAFLDQINTAATKKIVPGVTDLIFKADPLLAFLKKNQLQKYDGGPSWQENFLYQALNGDFYTKGSTFNISQVQTKTGGTVTPRYCEVNVSLFREDVEVEARGPQAVLNLVDSALQEAALGMSARLSIALYNHGQNIASGDRSRYINGLAEAVNDGTTNSWTGDTYPTYLTVPRNGVIGSALNAPMTTPAANQTGNPVSYSLLEQAYSRVTIGMEQPDLGITTPLLLSFIKMNIQPQQRFENTQDAGIGFNNVKFNAARIMASNYAPGTLGVNDAQLGNYLATAGETFWWLNTKHLRLYVSTAPKYNFGFTGFIPAQDNTTVAGQYLFSGNFTCTGPRYQFQFYGFTA